MTGVVFISKWGKKLKKVSKTRLEIFMFRGIENTSSIRKQDIHE